MEIDNNKLKEMGIAIERDRTQGVTRIHVQKVKFRHLGQPGIASFQYNTHCGRFVPIKEGKTDDLPDKPQTEWDNSNWLAKLPGKLEEIDFG